MSTATDVEPQPIGNGEDVTNAVIQDFADRAKIGEQRYGTRLKSFNGRRALVDAYQELLDFVVYFKQYMMENNIK